MAVLKIYESQTRVKDPQVAQTGALTLPVGLATQYGKAISSVGAVIENIALENKAEEDANEASDLIVEVNKKIAENYNKYSKSTKTSDVLNFADDLDLIDIAGSNKQVNELVNKHIRKQKNSLSLDLTKEITGNSISKSRQRKKDELYAAINNITSNDPVKRITGNRDYNNFFKNPENITFYGEEGLAKLRSEHDQLIFKNTFIKRIDNGEIDLLDPKVVEQIKNEFGDMGAKSLLERARAKKISDILNEEEQEKLNDKNQYINQLTNFTKLIDNINRNKYDTSVAKPTLDQIHDLYDIGSLNTAQYNALVKFYAQGGPEETDFELLDIINTQIAAAGTITDLDNIQRALSEDKVILDGLDPSMIVEFNTIIEKYKGDVLGITDYKKYQELLKTHVGDIERVMTFMPSGSSSSKEKIKSINALEEYNRQINLGANPEDAYLEVISKFSEKELPEPDMLPQPIGFSLTDVRESLNKNPDNAFDNLYKKAVDKFKKDGNIEDYKENLKRLDFIQDVFKVRKSIFPDTDNKYLGKYAVKKKKKDGDKPPSKGFTETIGEIYNKGKEFIFD